MMEDGKFRLWVGGCSHLATDLRHGRRSLADAITDSERGGDEGGPPFDWDIMLHLGDLKGAQDTPTDEDGELFLDQIGVAEMHGREHFYNLPGNHDASGPDEPTQWWFRTWIDPTGENTQVSGVNNDARAFPVTGAGGRPHRRGPPRRSRASWRVSRRPRDERYPRVVAGDGRGPSRSHHCELPPPHAGGHHDRQRPR